MLTKRTSVFSVLLVVLVCPAMAGLETAVLPSRVLITNDNGIDDPKIVALARAFATLTETWVIAPAADRSGSGSCLSVLRTGRLPVQRRELGAGIEAFAVDGSPADCVALALAGMMVDQPPDLVISGINGGPNLGADWMFSGTIGAARVAAFAGVKAIAVSGIDDDLPGAVEAAVEWVVRLSASPAVRELQPGRYLTVSLPRTAPGDIRGIRIVARAPLAAMPSLVPGPDGATWILGGVRELGVQVPADSDQMAVRAHYIAVVPMQVNEVDGTVLRRWQSSDPSLPEWPAATIERAPVQD